jgi:hypothetical protein
MEEQIQPMGHLFESISFYNSTDVIKFLDSMTTEQAFYVLTQAIQMAYSKNIYSLQESEILSKSLRLLTQTPNETPTE